MVTDALHLLGTLCLAGIVLMMSGCSSPSGYVFVHTRVPYTTDLHDTPVSKTSGRGRILHVEEPFSGSGLYAEFNSNAVGDIAARHGIKTIYWADMEVFSILGVWEEQKLHLYGEAE